MFVALLFVLALAWLVHVARLETRTPARAAELALVYLLVGYCGFPLLAVALGNLVWPDRAAAILGFPAGNPFQDFMSVALVGMSLAAILTLRLRGASLIGPAVAWGVFFAGATWIHVGEASAGGGVSRGDLLHIVVTHGLVSVLLVAGLVVLGIGERDRGLRARGRSA